MRRWHNMEASLHVALDPRVKPEDDELLRGYDEERLRAYDDECLRANDNEAVRVMMTNGGRCYDRITNYWWFQ